MRRIILWLVSLSLAFVIGVAGAWSSGLISKSWLIDEIYRITYPQAELTPEIKPVRTGCATLTGSGSLPETYDMYPTPNNLAEFWSEFQTAVRSDDKRKLFELTDVCDFHWEGAPISYNPRIEPLYGTMRIMGSFTSEEQFTRNYETIFDEKIRQHILEGQPATVTLTSRTGETYEGNTHLWWIDEGTSYTRMFSHNLEAGYKFAGLLVGPE